MLYPFSIDQALVQPQPMVNVDLMAARALRDETPHLIARNIAAAVRNIGLSQASCSADGGNLGTLLSLGTSLGGMMLDRADERTWTLLPSKIYINRMSLAYGKHTLTVNVNGMPYTQVVNLNQPYQVITFRVIGNQVLFNVQR